ncbi:hypothetical protein N9047_01290 [bacterium]|nr:hypothetical protein [bacterium]
MGAGDRTGQGTYSFEVKAREDRKEPWRHNKGQVEIDCIFVGCRNGEKLLLWVEAKSGKPNASLAKHKLMYPLAAVRNSAPSEIKVVPNYMKSSTEPDGLHFMVVECEDSTSDPCVIKSISAVKTSHLILHL